MAYTFDEPRIGMLAIANTDAGVQTASPVYSSGAFTTVATPPTVLGSIVRAKDPTYGEGEFICLKGVASTVVGSIVVYDGTTYATTLCPVTSNLARPIAVAMSANATTATFGWYQIGGTAVALKGTASIQPKVAVGIATIGKIGNTLTGKEIQQCRSANAATLTAAITSIPLILDRPAMQGRVT